MNAPRDWLICPYHKDSVEPRWDDEDPAVAWCPQCNRTIAVVNRVTVHEILKGK